MEFSEILNSGQGYFLIAIIAAVAFYFVARKKEGGDSTSGRPMIPMFTKNLTDLARTGSLDPVIGRAAEIDRVIQILSRRTKNNPILVGGAGVGKTALVEGLAERIAAGTVPDQLKNKQVLVLDISDMVSGTKYRGEFEDRMKRLMEEVQNANRTIILFVDEIHQLIAAGGAEGAIKAEDIIKPALARGDLQMVGATTNGEYDQFIRGDVTLARRFQVVTVDEPSAKDTKAILVGIRPKYEAFHNVTITDQALNAAITLSGKYIKNRSYPDKAIDLLDEACSGVKLRTIGKTKKSQVTEKDIAAVVKYYKKK